MDFRKLIEFGKGSYVVSVPKEWVVSNNLKKGSVLSIEKNTNSLVVSTSLTEQETEKTSIAISADAKAINELETDITTAYINGFSTIEILSKKLQKQDEEIKKIIMNLAGLEIMEQTNTKITARYLMDIREISLESLIRRMDNITRSLILDAMKCLDKEKNSKSIVQRDSDVNRLNFLLLRAVRSAMHSPRNVFGMSSWELFSFYVIAEKIEKIADRQKRIARWVERLELSNSFTEDFKRVYEMLNKSYVDVMKSFYQEDKKSAMTIELQSRCRVDKCNQLLEKDVKNLYKLIPSKNEKEIENEHMLMANIVSNLKAMATSIKMIARVVMNSD